MDRVDPINLLWFAGWLVALAALFALGLRLPLQPRLRRPAALAYVAGIVAATLGIAVLDFHHTSAAHRHKFMAASMFWLKGSGGQETALVRRTRAALTNGN